MADVGDVSDVHDVLLSGADLGDREELTSGKYKCTDEKQTSVGRCAPLLWQRRREDLFVLHDGSEADQKTGCEER